MRASSIVSLAVLTLSCSGPGKPAGSGTGVGVPPSIDAGVAASADAAPAAVTPKQDERARMVRELAALHFDKLGNPVLRWDYINKVSASKERPHKLLVVLVEFADRGFERFRGKRQQGKKLAAFYEEQLFDDTYSRVNTLSHYYYDQSGGRYHVTGQVLTPIKLSKPRAAYGMPKRPAGGAWRNDADPEGMVEEALQLAAKKFPKLSWSDFDRWDPKDYDGDGNLDEPDGYLDHFVLVFAGGGQASCQVLNELDSVFTPNAKMDAIKKLTRRQRECATRLWPHRFSVQKREGQGPVIDGKVNRLGGVPLSKSLWAFDYNMQSEYIGPPTFIHEFGHSIGLPDIYSRTSSNSTGAWEVMSGTADESPQSLSAWSRLMLGWLTPKVVVPPRFGGDKEATVNLRTLDAAPSKSGAEGAVMVVLPPKKRVIDLTPLPAASKTTALYSGQGNELNRAATVSLDLTGVSSEKIALSFDAWWEIEAGWDFAYFEVSVDGGKTWKRRVPIDRRFMPAKHGHDGQSSLPGFTGLSGDLDGDGKNESNAGCDPKKKIAHGEDKAAAKKSFCLAPTFVRVSFDLSDLRGKKVQARVRYFTDTAAVMRGILIDNVTLDGGKLSEDFEGTIGPAWKLGGWSKSTGRHEVLVPHYYLLEYRDPYAKSGSKYRYDRTLARTYYRFYYDPVGKRMMAAVVRNRPGVVAWYYNGAWAWSENDPGDNGPGEGFLLTLDSNPNEIPLPGWESWLKGSAAESDTHYETKDPKAQQALERSYFQTICYVRNRAYMPAGKIPRKLRPRRCNLRRAPLGRLRVNGKPLMYDYRVRNDYLPGPKRARYEGAGELVEVRTRKKKKIYRLRMRSMRFLGTQDNPFSATPFPDGITFYQVKGRKLVKVASRTYPARARFDDSEPRKWQNPKLPFGGVAVPKEGFSFEVVEPGKSAPAGTSATVKLHWK
jgi:M6 family metalloprotease-like protein